MKYKSQRSEIELRENNIFSKNNSILRGENTQTIDYSKINKIEKFKWSIGQYIFYSLGVTILGISFNKEESIGGGRFLIHDTYDDWVIRNIITGGIAFIILIVIGIYFNSKFGRNTSIYLNYNMGSKKVKRSIYTSDNENEIQEIIKNIEAKL